MMYGGQLGWQVAFFRDAFEDATDMNGLDYFTFPLHSPNGRQIACR